jgi:plasmid maintenance system antidote protein VapI
MSKYTTPAERIEQLRRKYGSYRKAAKALGVSATHLRQVAVGDRNISDELVQKLGLIAETKYRRWGT